jgi:integrase
MARRRRSNRALGPYYQKERKRWQVIRIAVDGETGMEDKKLYYFEKEEDAFSFRQYLDEENPDSQDGTVSFAINQYEVAKRKPGRRSMRTCLGRLNNFFDGMKGLSLAGLTFERLHQRLEQRVEARRLECTRKKVNESYESLISEMRDVRIFLRWCGHSKRKWVSQELLEQLSDLNVVNIVENLERRTGKPQLTLDEAATYLDLGLALVHGKVNAPPPFGNLKGHHGPIAALLPLTSGIDGQEIFARVVRDLDQQGAKLIIKGGKTRNRDVPVSIPEELRQPLLDLAAGRRPDELLFPSGTGAIHCNSFGADWVQRLCHWAKVPVVCPHGLRGTAATIANHYGSGGAESVAKFLRHADRGETAKRHYIGPDRVRASIAQKGFQVIRGGMAEKRVG